MASFPSFTHPGMEQSRGPCDIQQKPVKNRKPFFSGDFDKERLVTQQR